MNQNAVAEILRRYTAKPFGPVPDADDWAKIESLLGRPLPDDFKAILERTGGAAIGSGLCWMRNPAVRDNIYVALSHAGLARWENLIGEEVLENMRIALYPEPDGWIQVAGMGRTWFMLKPKGDDIVIADLDMWELIETGMTFSELMWTMFNDRELYDKMGRAIWQDGDLFFSLPGNHL